MRKYLSWLLLLLLIPVLAYAWNPMVVGSGTSTAADSCSPLGTAELYWDGEHTTSTVTGCVSGGTVTGTLGVATVSTDQNHTAGGQYALDCVSANEYLSFAVTAKDIFDSSVGFVSLWVYPTATTGNDQVFEAYKDADDKLYIYILTANTVRLWHEGNNSYQTVTSTDTVDDNQWNQIEARWNVAGPTHGLRINSGAWLDEADAIEAFNTGEPATIKLGEDDGQGIADTFYIDDFHIWVTYDQS